MPKMQAALGCESKSYYCDTVPVKVPGDESDDPGHAVSRAPTKAGTKAPTTTGTQAPTSKPSVVLLGDSWAEMSGTSLANFCKGAKVTNKGRRGSTAKEWATGSTCPLKEQPSERRSCNSSVVMGSGSFTHAVLSVGGNDFLDSSCSIQPSELQRRLEAAIGAVKAAGPAGMKVVLAGYCAGTIAMVRLEQRNTRDSSTWTVSHTSSTHMDMHIA